MHPMAISSSSASSLSSCVSEEEQKEYIFKSQFKSRAIPEGITLPQFVLEKANEYPNQVALVNTGQDEREFTYAQVDQMSRNVAGGLLRMGIQKGDVVIILLPNMPEYCILVFGIMLVGGAYSGANPSSHPSELEKQILDCNAKLIITDKASHLRIEYLKILPLVLLVDDDSFHAFLHTLPSSPFPHVSQDDICALPYSSGTTGASKGVMLTHRNLIANLCSTLFDLENINPGDNVTLGLMPFFHIYGTTGICCATLRTKGKVVVMPRFEIRLFLEVLIKHKVTFAPIVPPIVLALVKNPVVNEYDLSQLKLQSIMTAAAPLAPELQKSFEAKFPHVFVQEAYGLTEHSCITLSHCAPGRERGIAKKGSVGFIIPNLEIKFVDPETNKSLPSNTPGELCVRSQCVMKGYFNKVEATKNTIDANGWLHTGDIGYIDNDGDVFIVDRIKELIKYKGFQVPPAELEAILLSHPEVEDAAVVPYPDEEAGEVPAACVIRGTNSLITEEDVMNYVSSKVASYKRVRIVKFVDTIPKSGAGKILRRSLKDELLKDKKFGIINKNGSINSST